MRASPVLLSRGQTVAVFHVSKKQPSVREMLRSLVMCCMILGATYFIIFAGKGLSLHDLVGIMFMILSASSAIGCNIFEMLS